MSTRGAVSFWTSGIDWCCINQQLRTWLRAAQVYGPLVLGRNSCDRSKRSTVAMIFTPFLHFVLPIASPLPRAWWRVALGHVQLFARFIGIDEYPAKHFQLRHASRRRCIVLWFGYDMRKHVSLRSGRQKLQHCIEHATCRHRLAAGRRDVLLRKVMPDPAQVRVGTVHYLPI